MKLFKAFLHSVYLRTQNIIALTTGKEKVGILRQVKKPETHSCDTNEAAQKIQKLKQPIELVWIPSLLTNAITCHVYWSETCIKSKGLVLFWRKAIRHPLGTGCTMDSSQNRLIRLPWFEVWFPPFFKTGKLHKIIPAFIKNGSVFNNILQRILLVSSLWKPVIFTSSSQR